MKVYHHLLGQHAPAVRRAATVLAVGLAVGAALAPFVPWQLASILGWDAAASTFVAIAWSLILRADGATTKRQASREDDTQTFGHVLLVSACTASLFSVGFALGLADERTGIFRAMLVGLAVATVALSWTMLNTIYILRYARLYYGPAAGGIAFGVENPSELAAYRDFAYVAFTVGMTYQVSDTTLHHRVMRRAVLGHAIVAFIFGVVIIAGAVNLTAGLLR